MVYLTKHLGLAVVIWGKTAKFILSVIRKEGPRQGSVSPPNHPIPGAEIPEWEYEKWQEPAADLFTAELPFLHSIKNICAPIVETNENFYAGTPPLYDKFLTLQ